MNDKKIFGILILAVFIVLVIMIILDKNNGNTKKADAYISKDFITASDEDVLKKIDNEDSFILYIGYENCTACENYKPILKSIMDLNNVDIFYLNYKEINKKSEAWQSIIKNITTKQTMNIKENDKEKTISDTVGNIIKKYGYTPVTVNYVSGKAINAHIGSMTSSTLKSFLEN